MTGNRNLHVELAEHRAVVEVNEEGTEAAAFVMPSMSELCAQPPPPREFHCDHPFLYLIRTRPLNKSAAASAAASDESVIYFMGHFLKPPT